MTVEPWTAPPDIIKENDGTLHLGSTITVDGEDEQIEHTIELTSEWLRRHCHADARPPEHPPQATSKNITLWDPTLLSAAVGARPQHDVPPHLAGVPALNGSELAENPEVAGLVRIFLHPL